MLDMMREKHPFRWQEEGKKDFKDIKTTIVNAPMLVGPNFEKDFIIYYYASEHSLSSILTQQDDEGSEAPISFMSIPLKKHELNYTPTENHVFTIVKALKQFRYYILHSHSVVYVPEIVVKSILTQQEVGMNKRAVWVAKVQEYYLTIKPTSLVKGHGLCKMIDENKDASLDKSNETPIVLLVSLTNSWFLDIAYFLSYGECPSNMNHKERRNLRLKAAKYVISNGVLYKRGIDGTFLRCVDTGQQENLLKTYHYEACGGHFSSTLLLSKFLGIAFIGQACLKILINL
jgi:hypothetical protein